MRVAPIEASDYLAVHALHDRMGMPYAFPALAGPLFAMKLGVRDDHGNLFAAAAVKLVGEAFVWADPRRDPVTQARAVKVLSEAGGRAAATMGIEDVSAWLPPQVEQRFGPFLERLGWIRSPWRTWTRLLS